MKKIYPSQKQYPMSLASANGLKRIPFIIIFILFSVIPGFSQKTFNYTVNTSEGELIVSVLGHSSVMFNWAEKVIYVDPYQKIYDFSQAPSADIILITHQDDDHFDNSAINYIKSDSTLVVYPQSCFDKKAFSGADTIMGNGDSIFVSGIGIKAVPAYNIINTRHVKGVGNGYILTFGDKRVYLAGDTEIVPEMAEIKDIAIAFFGYSTLNMTTSMFIDAATAIKPEVVIPYHYDSKDISGLVKDFEDQTDIKIITGKETSTVNYQLNKSIEGNSFIKFMEGYLYFTSVDEGSEYVIYNVRGVKLKSGELNDSYLDVSNFEKGVYIINFKKNNINYFGKFVIK